ncbi:alpha- and gamma-adaptin-binding protein p34-like [Zootermopsis nevadensis]|uniref:Alpha-and gamma-adaptin-binding protein p34 n=1 Tax=Zootermopsis nevadensis TaxID=136037 RepID=A0A067RHI3_ZOONE|nr:alpha- and gamma-adaptin-binding protein p34-like [Zootermopsis nevadensis]KDR19806.1 Alpha- and gamma-adaptin-binding protein p34 [Zootermopsis nevadensis]
MEPKPCAVIASCTSTHPQEIIKLILGVDELPKPSQIEDGIYAYPWHIDTKYYTTDVNLCSVEKKTLGSEQFAMSVEAVVIHFDSNKNDGLAAVESWLSFLKEFEPEVQILLCERCHENPSVGVCRVTAQEWCVEQGFELVELNPELDTEWEAEQDFIETTGIKRVVQAMHAHLWPNLRMKGKPQHLSRTVQSMLNGGETVGGERCPVSELVQNLQNVQLGAHSEPVHDASVTGANINDIEDRIDELLGDSGGVAGFSSLFEQLHNMKEHVQGLPSDQRKACAEEVVMAFWRAIGGDADELDGLGESGSTFG